MMDHSVYYATEARRVASELRQLTINADVIGEAAAMLEDYATSLDNMHQANEALLKLELVRKAVFGDTGDEPNVYADYDKLLALEQHFDLATSILAKLCA